MTRPTTSGATGTSAAPGPPDPAAAEARQPPYYFGDFSPGRIFQHHWGRTITEADAVLFATQTHQYQPALFNTIYARQLGHDLLPVSELLTFSVVLGLSVEDLSESGGPFLGADDIKFLQSVNIGDTLHASSIVLSRRPSGSRPGWGIVQWRTVGTNQHQQAVLSYSRSNLVRERPSGNAPDKSQQDGSA
jgi:itaconyl-CoA hydratase